MTSSNRLVKTGYLCYPTIFWLLFFGTARADDPLRIAVAANFKPVLQQLVSAYESTENYAVEISSGSTGALYAQIRNGAPFDIFFAADKLKPASLEQAGLTRHRQTYAVGHLAFWSPGSPGADEAVLIGFNQPLAIANPLHAPYGQAAIEVLNHFELNHIKLIRGANIALTYSFVHTGNVTAGLVALSQVKTTSVPTESYWQIPASLHKPIEQQLVIMKSADTRAENFVSYLGDPRSTEAIERAGYTLPRQTQVE